MFARDMKFIPTVSCKGDEEISAQARVVSADSLSEGELVCIFRGSLLNGDGQIALHDLMHENRCRTAR